MTDPEKVRCLGCRGDGRILIGKRDPIEGDKMRSSITCPCCDGAGWIPTNCPHGIGLKAYWVAFEDAVSRDVIRQNALKKLTKKEREVLGL
jgi:DnaJ-class molecular chaperone